MAIGYSGYFSGQNFEFNLFISGDTVLAAFPQVEVYGNGVADTKIACGIILMTEAGGQYIVSKDKYIYSNNPHLYVQTDSLIIHPIPSPLYTEQVTLPEFVELSKPTDYGIECSNFPVSWRWVTIKSSDQKIIYTGQCLDAVNLSKFTNYPTFYLTDIYKTPDSNEPIPMQLAQYVHYIRTKKTGVSDNGLGPYPKMQPPIGECGLENIKDCPVIARLLSSLGLST